jgi:hypothetical protein
VLQKSDTMTARTRASRATLAQLLRVEAVV